MIDIMLNSAQMNLNAKVSVQSIQYYPFQWLHLQPNTDAILFKVRYICIKPFDELICKIFFAFILYLQWVLWQAMWDCILFIYLFIFILYIPILYLYMYLQWALWQAMWLGPEASKLFQVPVDQVKFWIYILIIIFIDILNILNVVFQSARWSFGFIFSSSYKNLKLARWSFGFIFSHHIKTWSWKDSQLKMLLLLSTRWSFGLIFSSSYNNLKL